MRRFLDDAGSDSEGNEGGGGVRSEAGEEGAGDEDKMLEGINDKIKMLEKSEAAEVKR